MRGKVRAVFQGYQVYQIQQLNRSRRKGHKLKAVSAPEGTGSFNLFAFSGIASVCNRQTMGFTRNRLLAITPRIEPWSPK
ncbi:hypothetical protein SLEP1_g12315 [Rubroshorea leprosula]|uniref:Uncharacterized protein n=1 Tax=Rubroshorea leprosula TaxID=152421 RepID=A0AAV5IC41_9ROSI|nr:hypothetical protein SLEP1_g12315 [Rubroshorea leprosula]